MLLNLSNHPSGKWTEKQKTAAGAYGKIKDIAFPQVSPEADSAEIKALAMEYSEKINNILKSGEDEKNAVHVMGEISFCHALVNKLQAAGIECLVSTTERDAVEKDGKRISTFRFVKFRKYP